MNNTTTDIFKVTYAIGDKCICTAQGRDFGYEDETSVHRGFLQAHNVYLGASFVAEVDRKGSIVLETIRRL